MGGRQIHPLLMALAYGSTFHQHRCHRGFRRSRANFGLSLLWLVMLNIFFGIFIAFVVYGKRTRRMGARLDAHTFPELIGRRFDSRFLQGFGGATIAALMPIYAAGVMIGGARFLEVQLAMDYNVSLLIFAAVVLTYVLFGGLKGIIYTDAFQGALMFFGMLILLLATYSHLGWFASHRELTELAPMVPQKLQEIGHRGWTAMPQFGSPLWLNVVTTVIMGVGIGVLAQPQLAVRFMTVKSSKEIFRALGPGGLFILTIPGVAYIVGALSNLYFWKERAQAGHTDGRRAGREAEHRQDYSDVHPARDAGVVRISLHACSARCGHVHTQRAVSRNRDLHRPRPVPAGHRRRPQTGTHDGYRAGGCRCRFRSDTGVGLRTLG